MKAKIGVAIRHALHAGKGDWGIGAAILPKQVQSRLALLRCQLVLP